jgi:hypothetical protein
MLWSEIMSDIPGHCTGCRIEAATGDRPQSPSAKPSQNTFFPGEILTMSKVKLIATLAFCAFLTPAFAQSLAERQARTVEEKTLEAEVALRTRDCTVTTKIDWSTFTDSAQALTEKEKRPSQFCKFALSAIGLICRGEDGKKSLQSNVKSLTCKQASPSTLTLEKGELVYGFDIKDEANQTDKIEKFLMEKL